MIARYLEVSEPQRSFEDKNYDLVFYAAFIEVVLCYRAEQLLCTASPQTDDSYSINPASTTHEEGTHLPCGMMHAQRSNPIRPFVSVLSSLDSASPLTSRYLIYWRPGVGQYERSPPG